MKYATSMQQTRKSIWLLYSFAHNLAVNQKSLSGLSRYVLVSSTTKDISFSQFASLNFKKK
jgi:hypothetical protein